MSLDKKMYKPAKAEDSIEQNEETAELAAGELNIDSLDQLASDLGLIEAGEFRSGNGAVPGGGFTGVRIGYPGFVYDGGEWNIVGVKGDALQFGLRASDGAALAASGDVLIDEDGITITADTYVGATKMIKWLSANGLYAGSIVGWEKSGNAQFEIRANNVSPWNTTGGEIIIAVHDDVGAEATRITLNLSEIVINDVGLNINFRVEGNTKANLLKTDALADEVSIDGAFQMVRANTQIFSGAISYTNMMHTLQSQSGSTDNLDTINGATGIGNIVVLTAKSGHTITVRDNVGNIQLSGSSNKTLAARDTLTLLWSGAGWLQLAFSNN